MRYQLQHFPSAGACKNVVAEDHSLAVAISEYWKRRDVAPESELEQYLVVDTQTGSVEFDSLLIGLAACNPCSGTGFLWNGSSYDGCKRCGGTGRDDSEAEELAEAGAWDDPIGQQESRFDPGYVYDLTHESGPDGYVW